MPELSPDQFETVYHASYDETPPHMMDTYPNITIDEAGAFFAGTARSAGDRAMTGRRYMHRYRVPRSSMSAELYGDDHMYAMDALISEDPEKAKSDRALADRARAKSLYAQSDQPELWQTTPVSKREAVDSERVLRYRNMYEDAGKDSVLIPKGAMRDGGVEYIGTDDLHEMADTTDFNGRQARIDRYVMSQDKQPVVPQLDSGFESAKAAEAEERKNKMEESRNRRNQLPLFDMPIDASRISVLD